jgi:hypothetical protein
MRSRLTASVLVRSGLVITLVAVFTYSFIRANRLVHEGITFSVNFMVVPL